MSGSISDRYVERMCCLPRMEHSYVYNLCSDNDEDRQAKEDAKSGLLGLGNKRRLVKCQQDCGVALQS